MLQFDRQDVGVPACLFRQLVVGQDVGALFILAQMLKP